MKTFIYIAAFFSINIIFSQNFEENISSYLTNNKQKHHLETKDFEDIRIISETYSNSLKANNVYVNQRFQGIPIYNSTSSFVLKNNQVIQANISFVNQLTLKINSTTPLISASSAINKASVFLGISTSNNSNLIETISNQSFVFENNTISLENIPVKLVFQRTKENSLRLAWDISIYLVDKSHYYRVRIDAISGKLLEKNDLIISCNFDNHQNHNNTTFRSIPTKEDVDDSVLNMLGDEQYRVFPFPIESPNHGSDVLVTNPANDVASPFGWHDVNGVEGAEYTITRGNNVFAQDDSNGNNGIGNAPDGGATLNFNFPFNFNASPRNMSDAASVNLFYWNNIMHDIWYQYGFDEQSGNFQVNNYGNSGLGSDEVNADSQDGSGINNANFFTPEDGQNPRMQMFLFTNGASNFVELLTINGGTLGGTYFGIPANFAADIPNIPLTEDLVLVLDDDAGISTDPNDACDLITNGADLDGKIVVIRRGECQFGTKSLAVQNLGAIAVIMVNNVSGDPIAMAVGVDGDQVTIPLIMVSNIVGENIINELINGNPMNGTLFGENIQYDFDGDVDNVIIAHEYGHGISNRLTGGALNSNCLSNSEQMGEGWSDWFGRMLMIQEGDLPEDAKGVGTYVEGESIDGQGIRNAPYSTDFSVNNFTYGATNNTGIISEPHGIGFVWATMLWDLNWAFINQYGFDSDLYNGTGGNNMVMQLVIDGLKLQSCSPGFVDGRDAIIQADQIANGGANFCLIWETFARRGLGFSASQGSSFSRTDQVEAFDMPTSQSCVLGLNDTFLNSNFSIYPNPAKNSINIQSQTDLGNVKVTIFNINGSELVSKNIDLQDTVNINIANLNSGIYIVQILGDDFTYTSKLVVN